MDLKHQLGIKIKTLRKHAGLSQAELAERIERTVDAVSAIERGKSLPSLQTIHRLSSSLGIPVAEFFDQAIVEASPRRAALIAEIQSALKELNDKDLARATEIIKTLAG